MKGMKTKVANMSLVFQRVTDDPVASAALDSDAEAVKTDVNRAMTKLRTMILEEKLLDKLDEDGRDRMIYAPIQSLWKKMRGLLESWNASWSTEDTCGLMLDIGLKLTSGKETTGPYAMTNKMLTSRRRQGVKGSDWEQNFIPKGTKTQRGVSATTIRLLKTLSLNNEITLLEIEAVMNGACMYWIIPSSRK